MGVTARPRCRVAIDQKHRDRRAGNQEFRSAADEQIAVPALTASAQHQQIRALTADHRRYGMSRIVFVQTRGARSFRLDRGQGTHTAQVILGDPLVTSAKACAQIFILGGRRAVRGKRKVRLRVHQQKLGFVAGGDTTRGGNGGLGRCGDRQEVPAP